MPSLVTSAESGWQIWHCQSSLLFKAVHFEGALPPFAWSNQVFVICCHCEVRLGTKKYVWGWWSFIFNETIHSKSQHETQNMRWNKSAMGNHSQVQITRTLNPAPPPKKVIVWVEKRSYRMVRGAEFINVGSLRAGKMLKEDRIAFFEMTWNNALDRFPAYAQNLQRKFLRKEWEGTSTESTTSAVCLPRLQT